LRHLQADLPGALICSAGQNKIIMFTTKNTKATKINNVELFDSVAIISVSS